MLLLMIISLVILAITLMAKSRGFALIGFCIDLILSYRTVSQLLDTIHENANMLMILGGTFILIFIIAFVPVVCTILQIILFNKYKPAKSVIIVRYLDPAGYERFSRFYSEKDYNAFAQNVIPQGYRIVGAKWGKE